MKFFKLQKSFIGSVLIEALVSVAIVSVGSLGLINLQGNLIRARGEANQQEQAVLLAKSKMEELRNYSTKNEYSAITTGYDNVQGTSALYWRYWGVGTNVQPDYKLIHVFTYWQKPDGGWKIITLVSRIAELSLINSGKVIQSGTTGTTPITPTNDNYNNNGGGDTGGDGQDGSQTVVTDDGTILVYDTASQRVLTINGHPAVTITGNVTKASGRSSPGKVDFAAIIVSASGSGASYCSSSQSATETVSYTCILQNTFSGSINIGGITDAKVCGKQLNTYQNQLIPLTGQDYMLFKSTSACADSFPYEIAVL